MRRTTPEVMKEIKLSTRKNRVANLRHTRLRKRNLRHMRKRKKIRGMKRKEMERKLR